MKMPVLVQHFITHREQNHNLSLYSFLKMHYNNPVKDGDWETDRKLPFVVLSEVLVLVFEIEHPLEIKNHSPENSHSRVIALNDRFEDKKHISNIWQPPRSC